MTCHDIRMRAKDREKWKMALWGFRHSVDGDVIDQYVDLWRMVYFGIRHDNEFSFEQYGLN